MRDAPPEITHRQLEEIRIRLDSGLQEMLSFETQLRELDKETLCLFLTLMVDQSSYRAVLDLLKELDPPADRNGIGFRH